MQGRARKEQTLAVYRAGSCERRKFVWKRFENGHERKELLSAFAALAGLLLSLIIVSGARAQAPDGPAPPPNNTSDSSRVQERFGSSRCEWQTQETPNDYVWIFAGGEPPNAFLKKIGVGVGLQDLTSIASKEAKQAVAVLS